MRPQDLMNPGGEVTLWLGLRTKNASHILEKKAKHVRGAAPRGLSLPPPALDPSLRNYCVSATAVRCVCKSVFRRSNNLHELLHLSSKRGYNDTEKNLAAIAFLSHACPGGMGGPAFDLCTCVKQRLRFTQAFRTIVTCLVTWFGR